MNAEALRVYRQPAWMTVLLTCAFLAAPAQAALSQRCNWGVGLLTPTASPLSTQVMMMPVVMDFGGPPFGVSKIAFISFENASQINRDGGGTLRIIDSNCREITMFPNPSFVLHAPPGCPIGVYTHLLAPGSGLAAGNLGTTPDVDIIGVLDAPYASNSNHAQLVALNLVGGHLKVKWCSSPLPHGDFIPGFTAPAIAQLDGVNSSSASLSEVIIDNKVFNANGTLRFTGYSLGGNNCAGNGGPPCPRSRTAVVANVLGPGFLPQVITGSGLYQSSPGNNSSTSLWTGSLGWLNSSINSTSLNLVYPAVARITSSSGPPDIVVVDTMQSTVRVLSSVNGSQLASAVLPGFGHCGGPPMIGDADGVLGPEIGVASCNRYTLFKYNNSSTLTQVWSWPTNDPSGQTTSTLVNSPTGSWIYYADHISLSVFNGVNGTATSVPNSSATAIEGPVIASFGPGPGPGALIVASNDYLGGYSPPTKGVRIFDDPSIGMVHNWWSEHTSHWTNVTNSAGAVPAVEPASWLTPAQNTYRVQQ